MRGGDNNINNAANWSPAQAPVSGDTLIFAGGTGLTPQVGATQNVASITFNAGASAFTLGGAGSFSIGVGGITNNSGSTQTFDAAIKLSAGQTWNAVSGDLVFNGAVNKNTVVLTIDGAFNTTINGVISSTAGLNKNGTGTLTLGGSAANTNTGTITVNTGTLVLAKPANVNAFASALTIGDSLGGANADVVRLNSDFQIPSTKAVTIESSGLLDLNGHSDSIGSGVTTLFHGGRIVTGGGSLGVQGSLTFAGGGSIDTGAGTLTFTGTTVTGSTSGSTSDIAGNFSLGGGARTFTIYVGVTMNVSAIISNGSFTKGGSGTLALTGANTYSGTTTLNTGTLTIGNDLALGTGTFDFSGGTVQASGAARTLANTVTVTTSTATIAGALDLTFSGDMTLSQNTSFNVSNSGLTTFAGTLGQDATSRNVTMTGAGTLILGGSAANTYNGTTTVSTGVLNTQKNGALGTTANGTSVTSGAALELQGGVTISGEMLTIHGSGIAGGGVLRSVSGANVWAGTIFLGAASTISCDAGTLTIGPAAITNLSYTATFAGAGNIRLTGTLGSGNLAKSGTGTLLLSGANTYTGTTAINAGTLRLGIANGVATARAVTVASGATLDNAGFALSGSGSATIDIQNGGTLQLGGSTAFSTGYTTATLGSGSTVEFNGTGAQTVAALAYGNLTVNKSAGTATLAGTATAQTFTLTTGVLAGGTVSASTGFILQSGAVSSVLAGAGSLTKSSIGVAILSGTNTYTGGTSIAAGTLTISSDTALGDSSVALTFNGGTLKAGGDFTSSRTLTVAASGGTIDTDGHTVILSGAINGSMALLKSGAGLLKITGANPSFTGPTTISAGEVRLLAAMGLSVFTVQGGGALSGTGEVDALTVQSGGTVAPGDDGCGLLRAGIYDHKAGAHLAIEIGGASAGAAVNGYDQLSITGGITLAGDLQGSLLGGFHPSQGQLFFILVNDGTDAIGGTFAAQPQGSVVSFGGANFQISYSGDSAGGTFTGGNDVALLAVPEPSALAGVCGGLVLIAFRRLRAGLQRC